MKHPLKTISTGITFALLASAATAQTTIIAVDDNYVTGGSSNRDVVQGNGGTSTELWAKRASETNGSRKIYIRFDVSGISFNPTDTATFGINLLGASSGSANFTFAAYGLDTGFTPGAGKLGTDWTEDEITWNNAPANNTGNNSTLTSDATQIGSTQSLTGVTPTTTGLFEFALGTVSNFIQADDTITIMMTVSGQSSTSPILKFASSDHATSSLRPTITVIPEPNSAGLLIALTSGAFLISRRKRK